MKDTIEKRAVKIAAKIMQAAGLCRYESAAKCRRIYTDEKTCDKCIEAWLLSKARKEIESKLDQHLKKKLKAEYIGRKMGDAVILLPAEEKATAVGGEKEAAR